MGLEAVTFISDLVITNPVGATDPKSQGDDHLRNIKKALKNTFPSFVGAAVTLTEAQLNNAALKTAANVFTNRLQTITATGVDNAAWIFNADSSTAVIGVSDTPSGLVIGDAAGNAVVSGATGVVLSADGVNVHHKFTSSNATTTLNGVAVSDFARLSQANAFTGGTQTTNVGSGSVGWNAAANDVSVTLTANKTSNTGSVGTLSGHDFVILTGGVSRIAVTGAGAVSINGVAVTDYARLSQANVFTASQTISHTANPALTITDSDNSVTGAISANGTGGVVLMGATTNHPTSLLTNNTARYDISSGGNHDFKTGTVAIGGNLTVAANIRTTLGGDLLYTGIISPAALGASQNDYAPSGHAAARVFRLDPNGNSPASVTGLAGGVNGRVVTLMRIPGTTGTIRFEQENASSTAANRFSNGASPITINTTFASIDFIYDGTLSRWVPMGVQTA